MEGKKTLFWTLTVEVYDSEAVIQQPGRAMRPTDDEIVKREVALDLGDSYEED
jgi:hypothetical protein